MSIFTNKLAEIMSKKFDKINHIATAPNDVFNIVGAELEKRDEMLIEILNRLRTTIGSESVAPMINKIKGWKID